MAAAAGSASPNAASNRPAARSACAWIGYPGAGSNGLTVTGTACGSAMSRIVASAAVPASWPAPAAPAMSIASQGTPAELSSPGTELACRAIVTLSKYHITLSYATVIGEIASASTARWTGTVGRSEVNKLVPKDRAGPSGSPLAPVEAWRRRTEIRRRLVAPRTPAHRRGRSAGLPAQGRASGGGSGGGRRRVSGRRGRRGAARQAAGLLQGQRGRGAQAAEARISGGHDRLPAGRPRVGDDHRAHRELLELVPLNEELARTLQGAGEGFTVPGRPGRRQPPRGT